MSARRIKAKDVEAALHSGEFTFYYQPKVSLLSGQMGGGEALLRWVRPDGRVVSPGDFLPVASDAGLMGDITAVMLPHLVADIERLRAIKPDIQVAFNVTACDLMSPYLVKMLRAFIGNRRLGPGNIQIEITETALLEETPRVRATLNELIEMGIEIAMDDYGTGYSSLDLLSRVPFSTLKLDHGVVRRMSRDSKATHIVRASLVMARELSIKTVAEGIESEEAFIFLAASGCVEGQGFWISRPVPFDEFADILSTGRQWPGCSIGLLHDAFSRHNHYRHKLIDLVYTRLRTHAERWSELPRVDLNHSPAHCRLDRFFAAAAEQGIEPQGRELLDRAHRDMHKAGRELVQAIDKGAGDSAVAGAVDRFMEHSAVVDAHVSEVIRRWLVGTIGGGSVEPAPGGPPECRAGTAAGGK